MRLIDADALLDALAYEFEGYEYRKSAKVVNNVPTVMEWVSVEKQAPEDNVDVPLMLANGKKITCGYHWEGKFYNDVHYEFAATHWSHLLPLPEK